MQGNGRFWFEGPRVHGLGRACVRAHVCACARVCYFNPVPRVIGTTIRRLMNIRQLFPTWSKRKEAEDECAWEDEVVHGEKKQTDKNGRRG